MIEINGNLVAEFTTFLQQSVGSFLPLLASVIGVFVAFAILRQLSFITKVTAIGKGGR